MQNCSKSSLIPPIRNMTNSLNGLAVFDPEEFSVEDTDAMLAEVFGRKEAPPS
jgi:hypothetical protein